MTILWQEFTHALRAIFNRPAFSALVIGVLAAGMACVIFMLVMIDGMILRPLPFAQPDRLLRVDVSHIGAKDDSGNIDDNDFLQIRRRLGDIADVALYANALIRLGDQDQSQIYEGGIVSTNLFRVFSVAPLLGRDFVEADGRDGAPAVVMLSYSLWQTRFGGDEKVLGREVRVNARPATVIGVMPKEYGYPHSEALWIPAMLVEGAKHTIAQDWTLHVVLRPAAGIDQATVETAMQSWLSDSVQAHPNSSHNLRAVVEPLRHYSPRERLFYSITLIATLLVLLIACANVANLLLTRTLGRRQELAVRAALGASRKRLVLHLWMHSLLLTLIAAAIALPLAGFAAAWQEATLRQSNANPPWQHLSLDATSLLFVCAIALLTALVTGLPPALRAGNDAMGGSLRDGARSIGGASLARVSRILVIGEIALSCVLLICVGTMVSAIFSIEHADLGIDQTHLLGAKFDLTPSAYPTDADQLRLYEKLTDALRAEPDVIDATVGQIQPGVWTDDRSVLPAGTAVGDAPLPSIYLGAVDDHALSTLGIPLREGRFFDSRDSATSERVAVVDRRFVERFGNGESVLGKRFRIDPRDPDEATVIVVGIIENVTLSRPQAAKYPSMLVPLRQYPNAYGILTVRTRGDALAFVPRLHEIMRGIDPDVPLYMVGDYANYNYSNAGNERQNAQWFGITGAIALLIASAGLFGVMAFNVGRRTREIGVRRALGSSAWRILYNLFGRSAVEIGVGLALGIALGIPFARLLIRYSGTVEVHDPRIWIGVAGVLIFAAIVAVIVPARRALRVDPVVALRSE